MDKDKIIVILKVTVAIAIGLLSFFVFSKMASDTSRYKTIIDHLDNKRNTVMEMTAASTSASAAITLLPGDTGTPIADKLIDLSGYFIVILCAIVIEKYMITITGIAAFKYLIPIACGLFAVNVFLKCEGLQRMAVKLAVFGVIIFLVVPTSVKISDIIENTYQNSVQDTINSAKESTKELERNEADASDDEKGILSNFVDKVKDEVSTTTTKFEAILNNFVEAIAVMLVTSCVIPIAVLLFFLWIVKIIFGVQINVPKMKPLSKMKKGNGTDDVNKNTI